MFNNLSLSDGVYKYLQGYSVDHLSNPSRNNNRKIDEAKIRFSLLKVWIISKNISKVFKFIVKLSQRTINKTERRNSSNRTDASDHTTQLSLIGFSVAQHNC